MSQAKFTIPNRKAILAALKAGNFAKVAAELVGIHYTTYFEWVARGEREQDDPNSEYAQFARDVAHAKANAENIAIKAIIKAGDDDWRAHAWFLERSRPDRWAQQDWRKNAATDDDDFNVDLSPIDPEEL